MRRAKFAVLCVLLVLSILNPVIARKTFGGRGHSYPKSGGLSGGGGGGHHYPSSGGLSGSGGSHGYPSSGGNHGYPSSGGSHGYPSSGGSHGYPSSGGLSGTGTGSHHTNNHGYPAGKGLSGNTPSTTTVHNHYHYSPPQQISYAPMHGGAPVSYPVYRGTPPNYVYQYKDSGSKYGTLLAGLALLNLGTLAGTAYVASQVHSNSKYQTQPGEVCKFGVQKDNGDYEETKIDCQLISSFILQEQAKTQGANNTTVTTTTVTNTTIVNSTNAAPEPTPVNQTDVAVTPQTEMLPNGTLVIVNATAVNSTDAVHTTDATSTTSDSSVNNTSSSSVITITSSNTTTTTVTNALDVKGKPIDVTPGMLCYVIRTTPSSRMKKSVPCGLLQTYADKSLKKNSAGRNVPVLTAIAVAVAFLMY